MITPLGKYLRKLRIDNDEILYEMAKKLGVTSSFLSAVENGKRRMPSEWNAKICELYSLDAEQRKSFSGAVAETEESISLNLNELSDKNRAVAVTLLRELPDFDDSQFEAVCDILEAHERK